MARDKKDMPLFPTPSAANSADSAPIADISSATLPTAIAHSPLAQKLAAFVSPFSRANRNWFSTWYWEVDKPILIGLLALMMFGLISVAAASPVAAQKLSSETEQLDPLYHFYRQLVWVAIAAPTMLAVSMLPKQRARRLSIYGAGLCLGLLCILPFYGVEINGARRWLSLGGARLQPSEFMKPFFTIAIAWLLSLRMHDRSLPVGGLSFAILACLVFLLMIQPDFGQTVIFVVTWMILMFAAGFPMYLMIGLVLAGMVALTVSYFYYPVAHQRVNNWLLGQGDIFQIEKAYETLTSGGLIGVGPGAGTLKFSIPEAHTDYIFSVIGEEMGLLICIGIVFVYLAMIVRVFIRMLKEKDAFIMLATIGLISQFGGQAIINIAVNLRLFPSKGMTLPFISYGGSSMIASAIAMGLLLCLARRNPYETHSSLTARWNRQ